jgi:uncharacterized protein (DUF58 family)
VRRAFYLGFRHLSSLEWRIRRRFTGTGIWLLGVLFASAVLGLDTNQTVAYQAFSFVLAALVVALAANRSWRARLSVDRVVPRFASAGERLIYKIAVRNHGPRALRGLLLSEDLEDPRPSYEEFLQAREPGEDRRNRFDRAIGYFRWVWLVSKRQSALAGHLPVPALPPGGQCELRAEITPLRRGRLTLTGVTVARPDSLGVCKAAVSVPATHSVLVLPRRYPVPPLELPGTRKHHQGGVALASSVGDSEEFVSLREYRPGDPLRRIHWRSCARVGKLIVKEHQNEFFVRHALVLDTFVDSEPSDLFEEAVSVAASLAYTIQTQESLLDLLFVGPTAYCFTAGRGLGQAERMLEVLACVRACRTAPFSALHHLVIQHHALVSGCICVLMAWDEDRRRLVGELTALGVPTLVLLIAGAEAADTPDAEGARLARFHRLEVGRIAEGLARL